MRPTPTLAGRTRALRRPRRPPRKRASAHLPLFECLASRTASSRAPRSSPCASSRALPLGPPRALVRRRASRGPRRRLPLPKSRSSGPPCRSSRPPSSSRRASRRAGPAAPEHASRRPGSPRGRARARITPPGGRGRRGGALRRPRSPTTRGAPPPKRPPRPLPRHRQDRRGDRLPPRQGETGGADARGPVRTRRRRARRGLFDWKACSRTATAVPRPLLHP